MACGQFADGYPSVSIIVDKLRKILIIEGKNRREAVMPYQYKREPLNGDEVNKLTDEQLIGNIKEDESTKEYVSKVIFDGVLLKY